jgi:excinuclease UvrABC nuclease subunit
MPFSSNSGYSFSETGIASFAPRASGVYGICNKDTWIYIGEAKDMEARLYDHLRGVSDQSARIATQNPTLFVFERCDEQTRKAREAELVAELSPVCNW